MGLISFSIHPELLNIIQDDMNKKGFKDSMSAFVKSLLETKYGFDAEYKRALKASDREFLSEIAAENLPDLEIIRLYNEGYSIREISEHMVKKSLTSVNGKPYSVPRVQARVTCLRSKYFQEMLDNDYSLQSYKS